MMDWAHQAWRSELRQVTVLDIVQMAPRPIRERTAARLAALSK